MTALEASANSTSLSLIAADGAVNHADADFLGVGLGDGLGQGFDRALHVGLDDQIDGLDLLGLHGVEQVIEGDAIVRRRDRVCRVDAWRSSAMVRARSKSSMA